MADCIQARITANLKAALKTIVLPAYHYNVAAVEEARTFLQIHGRWDFILLLENEPLMRDDLMSIEELYYSVWFFPAVNDELIGNPALDINTEIAYHTRNIDADIAKCLTVDITRGGLAGKTVVTPMGNASYIDGGTVLFGSLSHVAVSTHIDGRNMYNIK